LLRKKNHPEQKSLGKRDPENDKRNKRIRIKVRKTLFVIILKDRLMMQDRSYPKDRLYLKIKMVMVMMILKSLREKDMNKESSNNTGTKRKSRRKLSMTEFQMPRKVRIHLNSLKNTRSIQRSKMTTLVLTWINT
jgi:hypothetical protein